MRASTTRISTIQKHRALFILPGLVLLFQFAVPAWLAAQSAASWPSDAVKQEVNQHALKLWSKILVHCGDSYYYSGSGLDNRTQTGKPLEFSNGVNANVAEYKGVTFFIEPPPPRSMADRLNAKDGGFEEEGYAIMASEAFRAGSMFSKKWYAWQNGPLSGAAPGAEIRAGHGMEALARSLINLFQFPGTTGSLVVRMSKKQGKWYYSFWGTMDYISRAEDDLLDTGVTNNGAPVNLADCGSMPEQEVAPVAGARSPSATYSADDFIKLIPDALRKAAADRGLDPNAYDKELQFVSAAIKTCAQITPQMATDPARPERDAVVWSKYGKQYGICTTITSVDASVEAGNPHGFSADPSRPRTNDVMIRIGQPVGQHYKDGKGFEVSISVLYDKTPLFDSVNIGQDSQPRP